MRKTIAALLLFSTVVSAQVETIIKFQGQNAETITIDKSVSVVRPESFEVPDTCSRDIPYEVYECNDVTRYRQECSWIPESQNCYQEPDRVCRSVTRYRQECSSGPSRQVCTDVPSREVCVERPTREVCRTNSRGENVCQTVGGGQSCQTVGGGQTCRTESGPDVCRDVSYQDQDCDTVYRTRCDTVPGRNECRDIPYSENVCGNVTRYNTEYYACMRTEWRDITTVKQLKGKVNVSFVTNGNVEEFPLAVIVAPTNATHNAFSLTSALKSEPKVLVAAQKRRIKVASETEKEIVIEGDMTIETLDPAMLNISFPTGLSNVSINKATNVVSMKIGGSISATGKVDIELIHTPLIGKDKKLAVLQAEYPSDKVKINGDMLEINLAGLVSKLEKRMVLSVKLATDLALRGEILNAKKPKTEKSYGKLKIKQI